MENNISLKCQIVCVNGLIFCLKYPPQDKMTTIQCFFGIISLDSESYNHGRRLDEVEMPNCMFGL